MRVGASPDFATVKCTPLESYVGLPEAVNESTAPLVKSTLIDFPNAGSAGHAVKMLAHAWRAIQKDILVSRGSQLVKVCANAGTYDNNVHAAMESTAGANMVLIS